MPETEAGMPPPEGFATAVRADELPAGKMMQVSLDPPVRALLANVDGTFYAIRDMCGHSRAPLSEGELFGYHVECPLHYAIFDVRTGKYVDGRKSTDVATYEVRVRDGMVYIRNP